MHRRRALAATVAYALILAAAVIGHEMSTARDLHAVGLPTVEQAS